ncbi:MAG TPA: hypothetical protein H9892_05635, partial [Candidatus Protoclostridium stercorigallinarum]|nr:hypothetical protein [Candidatus Protoclostridium stercorigallinarum]
RFSSRFPAWLARSRSGSYGKREMRGNSRKARSFAVFYWGWHRVPLKIKLFYFCGYPMPTLGSALQMSTLFG